MTGLAEAHSEAGLVEAYSQAGNHWQLGPGPIYDRLADVLVSRSPISVMGASVVDVGAGTGAASRAVLRAGASCVVGVDPATGMLRASAAERPPSVAADARRLPLRDGCVDLAVAAFSLNHIPEPGEALKEIRRVVRRGGGVVAGTNAVDDAHPVKKAVEGALSAAGWTPPDWYRWLREEVVVQTSRVDQLEALAIAAGLVEVKAEHHRVPFPDLTAEDLVRWRLAMAQHTQFVSALDAPTRRTIVDDAVRRLGAGASTLVRSVISLSGRVS